MKNIGIFLAVAGLLVGCARQDEAGTETTQTDTSRVGVGAPAGAETGAAMSKPDDTRITQAVQNAINMGAQGRQADVQVTVQNGVVTLKGAVASQQDKQDVEARVKAVAGVTRVDNQLEIKADAQTPPQIQPPQTQPQQGQSPQPQPAQPNQPRPQ